MRRSTLTALAVLIAVIAAIATNGVIALAERLSPADISALEEQPLSTVVPENSMFTTILDGDGRIVGTNDASFSQDEFYANGGTVERGQTLYVRFRFTEFVPHSEGGIRENVAYYLDLPEELIPLAEDDSGNPLVDPDSPVDYENEAAGWRGLPEHAKLGVYIDGGKV